MIVDTNVNSLEEPAEGRFWRQENITLQWYSFRRMDHAQGTERGQQGRREATGRRPPALRAPPSPPSAPPFSAPLAVLPRVAFRWGTLTPDLFKWYPVFRVPYAFSLYPFLCDYVGKQGSVPISTPQDVKIF